MKLLNTFLIVAIRFKAFNYTTNIILYEFEGDGKNSNWIASVWPNKDGTITINANITEQDARWLLKEQSMKKVIPLGDSKIINGSAVGKTEVKK